MLMAPPVQLTLPLPLQMFNQIQTMMLPDEPVKEPLSSLPPTQLALVLPLPVNSMVEVPQVKSKKPWMS